MITNKVRKFRTQREFLIYLNALLPSNSTITALAPDVGDDFRPYQLSTPLKGAEIKRFRDLFNLAKIGEDSDKRTK